MFCTNPDRWCQLLFPYTPKLWPHCRRPIRFVRHYESGGLLQDTLLTVLLTTISLLTCNLLTSKLLTTYYLLSNFCKALSLLPSNVTHHTFSTVTTESPPMERLPICYDYLLCPYPPENQHWTRWQQSSVNPYENWKYLKSG